MFKNGKKTGTMLEGYAISASKRSVNVTEAASNEELARYLRGNPMFPFLNAEVYPLSDWEESMNASIERAKQAEKRFPGGAAK